MLHNKKAIKAFSTTAAILTIGLLLAEPAQAADFLDRIGAITGKLGQLKTFMVYIAFLGGLGGLIWGGFDMLQKSKHRGGDEITWTGILIKFIAGALLVAVTFTGDTMQQTLFGTTNSAPTANTQ